MAHAVIPRQIDYLLSNKVPRKCRTFRSSLREVVDYEFRLRGGPDTFTFWYVYVYSRVVTKSASNTVSGEVQTVNK